MIELLAIVGWLSILYLGLNYQRLKRSLQRTAEGQVEIAREVLRLRRALEKHAGTEAVARQRSPIDITGRKKP